MANSGPLDDVFIYWDNSNVFIQAQQIAEDRNGGENVHARVRLQFTNLLQLAAAGRHIARAIAAGSVPPELRSLWKNLQARGVQISMTFITLCRLSFHIIIIIYLGIVATLHATGQYIVQLMIHALRERPIYRPIRITSCTQMGLLPSW
jgi:hypothetical protein